MFSANGRETGYTRNGNGDLGVGKIPYGANSDSVRGELAVRGVRTGSSRQSEHTLSPISFVVRFIFRTFADKA